MGHEELKKILINGCKYKKCKPRQFALGRRGFHELGSNRIAYTKDRLQIGCEGHLINDWWEFDDRAIQEMDGLRALDFWRANKEGLKKLIESDPAK